jgi:hypothetical protein
MRRLALILLVLFGVLFVEQVRLQDSFSMKRLFAAAAGQAYARCSALS